MTCCTASLGRRRRLSEDIEAKLLVELDQVTLRSCSEEFGGERSEDAVIAGGVIAQGVTQLRRHQTGIAGAGQQMIKAGQEFIAAGELSGEPGTAAQRD